MDLRASATRQLYDAQSADVCKWLFTRTDVGNALADRLPGALREMCAIGRFYVIKLVSTQSGPQR